MKDLPGNEYFKRYVEIAATGDLNILCLAPHQVEVTIREYSEQILTDSSELIIVAPCPCGYFGDYTQECKCTVAKITKWQTRFKKNLDKYHIITEVVRPEAHKIIHSTSESVGKIRRRVSEARKYLPAECRMDSYAKELLEQAISRCALFPIQVENIKKIAVVSSALAGKSLRNGEKFNVVSEHIAEAIVAVASDTSRRLLM